jgi:DHA2 family multidrug resistance protein
MFQAIGIPFLFVPITNVAYVGLRPDESNQASALMNVSRNLGGTIGISAVQTLLAQREQFHQARLVEHLDPLFPNYRQGLGQITHDYVGLGAGNASMAGLSDLYNAVRQQAAMLSYIDVFHALMIVVFLCVPILFFMKGRQAGAAPAAAA